MTLTYVPISVKVISLKQSLYRLLWFFIFYLYTFFLTINVLGLGEVPNCSIIALGVVIASLRNEKFVLYLNFLKKNRIAKVYDAFNPNIITILITAIVFFVLSSEIRIFLLVIYLFLIIDLTRAIIIVIASENVSFASGNGRRLIDSMSSSGIMKFLAYEYFFNLSGGAAYHRRFLFKDLSGRLFGQIVDVCTNMFKAYADRHLQMQQHGSTNVPLHQINNTQWRRSQRDRPFHDYTENEKQGKIKQFNSSRKDKMQRMKREAEALQDSALVMYAAQALVRLIFVLPTEDQYGVGQIKAEQILDGLLTLQAALEGSVNYGYISGDYGSGWYAKGPMDLTLKTKETIDWGIQQLARHFPTQLDLSSLSKLNQQKAYRLFGRRQ